MSQEIINLIVTIAPSIAGIVGMIFSFILALKKVTSIINDFRQSNELKNNNEQISKLLADNAQLKKMNEKLLVELTRIKPLGWTDDQSKN